MEFLVNKDAKLALTNEHITEGHDEVDVFFPAYDSDDRFIQERDFYKPGSRSVLRRLGYYTKGRVVAENRKTDVAIVILKGLPKTAKEIKNDQNYDYSHLEKGTPVYIVGHPGNRDDLWQLDFGVFEEYQEQESFGLVLYASAYHGNSGGPVVDKNGVLIGIVRGGDRQTKKTFAVPIKHILDLTKKIDYRNTFSIQNRTESTVVYKIRWSESGDWKQYSIEPDDKSFSHVNEPDEQLTKGYPKIRYKEPPEAMLPTDSNGNKMISDDASFKTYELNTTSEIFHKSLKERFPKQGGYGGYEYLFGYDSDVKEINLRELRETVWIANNLEVTVKYEIKWTSDESTKWDLHSLEPDKAHPHWWQGSPVKEILDDYPKIRFRVVTETRPDLDEVTWTLISREKSYGVSQTLKVEPQSFSIDTTEQENIIDAKKPGAKTADNYYRFAPSPRSSIDLHHGAPPVPVPERSQDWRLRDVIGWLIIAAIIGGIIGVMIGWLDLDEKILLWFRRLRNSS